jgi:hypothetical protein
MLLRHAGGLSASWARRVLHDFADASSKEFTDAVATRLLSLAADGESRVQLYVDNHLRPYTGKHTVRKAGACRTSAPFPERPTTTLIERAPSC